MDRKLDTLIDEVIDDAKSLGVFLVEGSGDSISRSREEIEAARLALVAEIEKLEAQIPRWRPASEKPIDEYVLIFTDLEELEIAKYDHKWGWNGLTGGWEGEVTHWMPLPEPPEEVE